MSIAMTFKWLKTVVLLMTLIASDLALAEEDVAGQNVQNEIEAQFIESAKLSDSPAKVTPKRNSPPPIVFGKVIFGLVAVIILILILAWMARRANMFGVMSQTHIKLLGSMPLGTREKAVLIEVQGQRLLLGVAPGRVSSLHAFEGVHSTEPELENIDGDHRGVATHSFSKYLTQVLQQGGASSESK